MKPADLREARKNLGLTQKGLAEALRMGAHGWQSISAWESDNDPRNAPGPVEVAIEHLLKQNGIPSPPGGSHKPRVPDRTLNSEPPLAKED